MASFVTTVGGLSSTLGLITSCLSIASSLWLKVRYPFYKNDIGIMRHCDAETMFCGDMDMLDRLVAVESTALFRSVQAFYLLHCIGHLVSTSLYLLYMTNFLESKGSFRVLTAVNFLTVTFGAYTLAVFGTQYLDLFGLDHAPDHVTEEATLGRAFYFAVAACSLAALTMLFSAMEASQAAGVIRNMHHRMTVWSSPYTLFVDQEHA